jgi:hypothetical protein
MGHGAAGKLAKAATLLACGKTGEAEADIPSRRRACLGAGPPPALHYRRMATTSPHPS